MIYNGNTLIGDEVFDKDDIINFEYSAKGVPVKIPRCKCKIELWGARGSGASVGGGYVCGLLSWPTELVFYIYVGGAGIEPPYNGPGTGGWNGGGNGGNSATTAGNTRIYIGGGGGGATDIRLVGGTWNDITSLRSRILVAPGAGGGYDRGRSPDSQYAGEINSAGATQTGGWRFGYGRNGTTTPYWGEGGGGGGYYGGSVSWPYGCGGSAFISGMPGCDAVDINGIHTGQSLHYSGIRFTYMDMKDSRDEMPNPRGEGTIFGNNSHGYVRISIIKMLTGEVYFVGINEDLFYREDDDWKVLDKKLGEVTINDIINHGIGTTNYLSYDDLLKVGSLNTSNGPIKFITGVQTIEDLKSKNFIDKDIPIEINVEYKFLEK